MEENSHNNALGENDMSHNYDLIFHLLYMYIIMVRVRERYPTQSSAIAID